MKLIILIITFTFFSITSINKTNSENKIKSEVLYISVNGLVCDFCARSIEKLFSKNKSVESIKINLEKMLITVYLIEGTSLDDNTISKLIINSGYDVREIRRDK